MSGHPQKLLVVLGLIVTVRICVCLDCALGVKQHHPCETIGDGCDRVWFYIDVPLGILWELRVREQQYYPTWFYSSCFWVPLLERPGLLLTSCVCVCVFGVFPAYAMSQDTMCVHSSVKPLEQGPSSRSWNGIQRVEWGCLFQFWFSWLWEYIVISTWDFSDILSWEPGEVASPCFICSGVCICPLFRQTWPGSALSQPFINNEAGDCAEEHRWGIFIHNRDGCCRCVTCSIALIGPSADEEKKKPAMFEGKDLSFFFSSSLIPLVHHIVKFSMKTHTLLMDSTWMRLIRPLNGVLHHQISFQQPRHTAPTRLG